MRLLPRFSRAGTAPPKLHSPWTLEEMNRGCREETVESVEIRYFENEEDEYEEEGLYYSTQPQPQLATFDKQEEGVWYSSLIETQPVTFDASQNAIEEIEEAEEENPIAFDAKSLEDQAIVKQEKIEEAEADEATPFFDRLDDDDKSVYNPISTQTATSDAEDLYEHEQQLTEKKEKIEEVVREEEEENPLLDRLEEELNKYMMARPKQRPQKSWAPYVFNYQGTGSHKKVESQSQVVSPNHEGRVKKTNGQKKREKREREAREQAERDAVIAAQTPQMTGVQQVLESIEKFEEVPEKKKTKKEKERAEEALAAAKVEGAMNGASSAQIPLWRDDEDSAASKTEEGDGREPRKKHKSGKEKKIKNRNREEAAEADVGDSAVAGDLNMKPGGDQDTGEQSKKKKKENGSKKQRAGTRVDDNQMVDEGEGKSSGWDKFGKVLKGEISLEPEGNKKRKNPTLDVEHVEPPKKKHKNKNTEKEEKKNKKDKKAKKAKKANQNPIASENAVIDPIVHQKDLNKIQEQHGKTVSNKKHRREEQTRENIEINPDDNEMTPPKKKCKNKHQAQEDTQQIQASAKSTQKSALRTHKIPKSINKAEALRLTITKGRVSPMHGIINSTKRSQAPSPSSTDAQHKTDLTSKSPNTQLVHETRIHPPSTIHSQLTNITTPMTTKKDVGKNISNDKPKDATTSEPEPTKQKEFVDAVSSIQKKLDNQFSTLFSPVQPVPIAMDWAPTAAAVTFLVNKTSTKVTEEAPTKATDPNDWESKPGKIRAHVASTHGGHERLENIAFSSTYISRKSTIKPSRNTTFSTLSLKSGEKVTLKPSSDESLRICSVAEGRVRVLIDGEDNEHILFFKIGKGGVWRVREGEKCEVTDITDVGKGKDRADKVVAVVFVVGVE